VLPLKIAGKCCGGPLLHAIQKVVHAVCRRYARLAAALGRNGKSGCERATRRQKEKVASLEQGDSFGETLPNVFPRTS